MKVAQWTDKTERERARGGKCMKNSDQIKLIALESVFLPNKWKIAHDSATSSVVVVTTFFILHLVVKSTYFILIPNPLGKHQGWIGKKSRERVREKMAKSFVSTGWVATRLTHRRTDCQAHSFCFIRMTLSGIIRFVLPFNISGLLNSSTLCCLLFGWTVRRVPHTATHTHMESNLVHCILAK